MGDTSVREIDKRQIAEALYAAAGKIARRGAWTQRATARDSRGAEVEVTSTSAVRWCACGAPRSLDLPEALVEAALAELGKYLRSSVMIWNDAEDQNQRRVVRTMRACAEQLVGIEGVRLHVSRAPV